MNQYNSLNVKLSNSQLNKSKSAIKNETEVVLRLSQNMIVNTGDETTLWQVATNLHKAFANNLSTDIELSQTQLSKMIQSGGFFWQTSWSITKNRITINEKYN